MEARFGAVQVVNKIEDLPASTMDDDIRWRTYDNIYRDPFLSRRPRAAL